MNKSIRIGTRDSRLALWQATLVQQLLEKYHHPSEIVKIKSEGDLNVKTPLYEMGVQGIFTRNLDAALLGNKIDVAVHSMKDVPVIPAKGIIQAAVLKRGAVRDLLAFKASADFLDDTQYIATIATGSTRRKAQWLHRYPTHHIVDLRGNVNTRLRKLQENNWDGAIFAAAGLERINLRPESSVELEWMLPAPAQGAIMVACRKEDTFIKEVCQPLNDAETALCTQVERDFLRTLSGGCSTPISGYACIKSGILYFEGSILSIDGKEKVEIKKQGRIDVVHQTGKEAAEDILKAGGKEILEKLQ
ncbi:MAG: hydroxymethylbilane synthase [Chitinophagaceae bacterium]|nr:MAG: hydroxymethylbilane synthase [Chitinophagaceae bacterium]